MPSRGRLIVVVAVLCAVLAAPARAVTATDYVTASGTRLITSGPDNRLWFTESDRIGAIATDGTLAEYTAGIASGASPRGIVAGPDGNLWFTEEGVDKVAKITTSGTVTEYAGLASGAHPSHITAGPDGNLWFTEPGKDQVAKITTAGVVTEYGGLTTGGQPTGIAAGPDGALWVTEPAVRKIARITTSGSVTEYGPTGISSNGRPTGIVAGPDGALWFGEDNATLDSNIHVGRITTAGTITETTGPYGGMPPIEVAVAGSDLVYAGSRTGSTDGEVGRVLMDGLVGRTTFSGAPLAIAQGADGNFWVTNGHIRKLAPATPPSVTTGNADAITQTGATVHGTVTASPAASWAFEYGTTNAYGSRSPSTYPSETTGAVSRALSGLTGATTYHYRLVATNLDGTVTGNDATFDTAAGATKPAVDVTGYPPAIGTTTATTKATINPHGAATTYHVDYGPTAAYGSSTVDGNLTGDSSDHTVFVDLTGVPSGATTHYRVVATNSAGTTTGADRTFTTYTAVPASGPGSLAAFGSGGTTALDFGSTGFVEFDAVAAQDDGKLVLAGGADTGGTRDVAVARLNGDGTNDATFNGGAPLLVPIAAGPATATGVAIQPDGHIVVVANAGTTGQVLRLTSSGALDDTFDGDGIEQLTFSVGDPQTIRAVAVQPADGKIVVAGSVTQGASEFALARLNADGTGDATFDGGVVLTPFSQGPSFARAVAVQDDGAIVAAGGTTGGFAAARYDTGGVLDASFGSGGRAFVATPGGAPEADALALDPFDGGLLLAGPSDTSSAVVRLTAAGAPDPGFGTAGVATLAVPGASPTVAEAVIVSGAGGPLVAGSAVLNGEMHGFLARLTTTGAFDGGFGQSGLLTFDGFDAFHALAQFGAPTTAARDAGSDAQATAAAGAKVTATDPSGNTPTTTSGSATKVYDCFPEFRFDPDPLTFPPLTVGQTSAPRTVTVTNIGDCAVVIRYDAAAMPNGQKAYAIVAGNCVVTRLEPGQSCTIDVTYTATQAGVQDGYVTIGYTAARSGRTFASGHVTGTGVDVSGPPPSPPPAADITACAGRTVVVHPPPRSFDPGDGIPVIQATNSTLPSGQKQFNDWTFTASGGRAPYAFSVAPAPPFKPLPDGLDFGFGADGTMRWYPGQRQSLDIVVTATDADGCVGHLRFLATVRPSIDFGRQQKVPANGRTTVPGTCPPGAAACGFGATVSAAGGKARAAAAASIGTIKGTIAAGRTGRLKLVLNRRGIAKLRHARVLNATFRGTVRQGKLTTPITGSLKLARH